MTRLTVLCLLALFAYGLALGCEGRVHRDTWLVERADPEIPGAVIYTHFCACQRMRPFTERVRWKRT